MHIDGIPNRTSHPTYLLCELYREGKKVHKRTLANLSTPLSDDQIEVIRDPHGHVRAVRVATQKRSFGPLIAS